jgi:hypothetical protein
MRMQVISVVGHHLITSSAQGLIVLEIMSGSYPACGDVLEGPLQCGRVDTVRNSSTEQFLVVYVDHQHSMDMKAELAALDS